jgi:Collagen triple helix repeat (20 copies)
MFQRVTKHITPASVLALVALVFAITGGAFAASGGSGNGPSHATLSASAAKAKKKSKPQSTRGPAGPKGATGVAGAMGPAGPQGAPGAAGAAGKEGPQGAKGGTGPEGQAGKEGQAGARGAQGNAGEAGMCSAASPECKLASGATLTGAWGTGGEGKHSLVQISFPVKVSPAPTALVPYELLGHVVGVQLNDGGTTFYGPHTEPENAEEVEEDAAAYSVACPGDVAAPQAAAGFLCIYEGAIEGTVHPPLFQAEHVEAAHEFGLVVPFEVTSESSERGSWAVAAN